MFERRGPFERDYRGNDALYRAIVRDPERVHPVAHPQPFAC